MQAGQGLSHMSEMDRSDKRDNVGQALAQMAIMELSPSSERSDMVQSD